MGTDVREPLKELSACGLPAALEVMGERWSFMILRASFNGVHHFEEFLSELGIARNILSNRLSRLVEHGILDRVQDEADRRRVEYCLTEKGFDLLPAMVSLRHWGLKYGVENVGMDPVIVDERDRMPIGPVAMLAHDGRILGPADLNMIARKDLPEAGRDRREGTPADAPHALHNCDDPGDALDAEPREAAE